MMNEEDKEYLQELRKGYIESSSQFDKQLLFFASGALGLSFAFIKDIVKLDVATHKCILITSWILFGAVIILSIISHYTSLKAINRNSAAIVRSNSCWRTRTMTVVRRWRGCR